MKKITLTVMMMAVLLSGRTQTPSIPKWKVADLQNAIDSAHGPTIFNFWATFCIPCIAELPQFQKIAARYRNDGVKLVLVSLDLKEAFPKTISAFVKKLKITAPVVFLDESDAGLFVPLVDSSWSGAIPATLFVNPGKGYCRFIEDEISKANLEEEIRRMLGTGKGGVAQPVSQE